MLRFPNCKINIGLSVVEKRDDGYHNIETVFYPVKIEDALEIVPAPNDTTRLFLSGAPIYGDPEKNLVMKAYRLMEEAFRLPPVHIYLHKIIPFGAGLGGGSSDATQAILILNDLFELHLSTETLHNLAGRLGADCPFFLENRPLLATGKGDLFEDTPINIDTYWLMLIKPPYSVNTKDAYEKMIPKKAAIPLKTAIQEPVDRWKDCIFNDFEKPVFERYPFVKRIKDVLYDNGALYASMSGSGSAVYGIFREQPFIQCPENCTVFIIH